MLVRLFMSLIIASLFICACGTGNKNESGHEETMDTIERDRQAEADRHEKAMAALDEAHKKRMDELKAQETEARANLSKTLTEFAQQLDKQAAEALHQLKAQIDEHAAQIEAELKAIEARRDQFNSASQGLRSLLSFLSRGCSPSMSKVDCRNIFAAALGIEDGTKVSYTLISQFIEEVDIAEVKRSLGQIADLIGSLNKHDQADKIHEFIARVERLSR